MFNNDYEYINVSVPVPKNGDRPTIVKVEHETFGCPTISIKQESWKEILKEKIIEQLKEIIKTAPKVDNDWFEFVDLIKKLDE